MSGRRNWSLAVYSNDRPGGRHGLRIGIMAPGYMRLGESLPKDVKPLVFEDFEDKPIGAGLTRQEEKE